MAVSGINGSASTSSLASSRATIAENFDTFLQLRDPSQDGRQPGRGTERGPGAPRPAAPSAEASDAVPSPPPRRLWGGRVGVDVRI